MFTAKPVPNSGSADARGGAGGQLWPETFRLRHSRVQERVAHEDQADHRALPGFTPARGVATNTTEVMISGVLHENLQKDSMREY